MSSRILWFTASVIAMGGFLFGYDWVVIGGAKPFYEAHFGIVQPTQEAWAMSCALVGCLIGALLSGVLGDRLGRRYALMSSAAVFAVSSIGTGLSPDFTSFVLWRIAGGLAIGMASGLSPLYIAEIAPAKIRGKLVCLNELTIVFGILTAQIDNWLIARPVPAGASMAEIASSWNGREGWRWMFAAAVVPSLVFFLGTLFIPESPRWLSRSGLWTHAHYVLARLGGEEYAEQTMIEMRAEAAVEVRVSVTNLFRRPGSGLILTVGVVLAILQQWCGINVIFNYAQEVFSAAGYELSNIFFNIVITGVVMCLFTFLAIATVEKLGRRRLMLFGCGGLFLIFAVLGLLYALHQHGLVLLILVVAAIACFAMTLAPITWVILSEIFPNDARGLFMAISTTSLWAACFTLTYTFPLLNSVAGMAKTFWLYAGICAAGFLFVWRFLPETKGCTLEQIQKLWQPTAIPVSTSVDATPVEPLR